MNGSDLFVQMLKAHGVEFVATVSGNGLNPFYVSCQKLGLRLVDFRNEQAASYAADAYARLTGKVGVCAVSSAIAHVNAFAGLMNAYFDGSPVFLFTGASDQSRTDAGRFQDVDQVAIAKPLCKYAREVHQTERIPFYVHEAISHAVAGRPGPVHLTIPLDVLYKEAEPIPQRLFKAGSGKVEPRGSADPALIAEAATLIEAAKQPLIISGSGVFYARANDALDRLASLMHLPVQVPIWDRANIQQPTPYFMGVIGAASGGPAILKEADLVILVGAQVDYRVGYLEDPAVKAEAKVIRIDVDDTNLLQGVEPDLAILADPRSALVALAAELERRGAQPKSEWLEQARAITRKFRSRWDTVPAAEPQMTGHHVVAALRPLLDDEILLMVDGGNIGQWANIVLGDRYPGNWLTCGASAVVGWGLPGAIGAKVAFPDRPVLLLSGDGSFGFTTAEIETAVRHNLPFVAVVADDRAWGIVISGQLRQYGPEGVIATRLGEVRYDRVAEGFGALGLRAERPEEILPAIRQGFESGRPTVVHVPVKHGGPSD